MTFYNGACGRISTMEGVALQFQSTYRPVC